MATKAPKKFKSPLLNILVFILSASCLSYHIYRIVTGLSDMAPVDKVLTFIYVICFLLIIIYAVFRSFRSADFFTWMLILLGAVTLYTQVLFPVPFNQDWIKITSMIVALLVYGGLVAFSCSWTEVAKCNRILLFVAAGLAFNEIIMLAMKMKGGDAVTLYAVYEAVSPLVILLNLALVYNLRMKAKKPSQENL